jgi:hypothetical protein
MEDDKRLRQIVTSNNPGVFFEHLRATYPQRPEFRHFSVTGCKHKQPAATTLRNLGFTILDN